MWYQFDELCYFLTNFYHYSLLLLVILKKVLYYFKKFLLRELYKKRYRTMNVLHIIQFML